MSHSYNTTPRKSVVQVPDSSPSASDNQNSSSQPIKRSMLFGNVKPKQLDSNGGGSLREKFSFNGSNLLESSNSSYLAMKKDLEILQGLFKTVSPGLIKAVYTEKASKNLKLAKKVLTALVESRKQKEILKAMQQSNKLSNGDITPSNFSRNANDESPKGKNAIEIASSPDISPQKASSKVILNKSKTIAQKFSAFDKGRKLEDDELQIISPSPEPQIKKRRLVRGTRDNTPVIIESEDEVEIVKAKDSSKSKISVIDDEEEEDGEKEEGILNDDFSDSEVEEGESDSERIKMEEQVLDFFNTVEGRDIMDVCTCTFEISENIIKNRPFRSINHFESFNFKNAPTSRRKKTDGEVMSQRANLVLRGYQAVDDLVKQCNAYSDMIANKINKWGVQVHGVNDELEIVEIPEDHQEDFDDEDTISTGRKKDKGGYLKDKPSLLSDTISLKNYQQVGLNWLYLLYEQKLSCILADEMGLGKTCQVIAFLAYLKEKNLAKSPHLIVVPSSTLENWMREFKKFAPSFHVEPYYGSQAERDDMRRVMSGKWNQIDVVVTTYNLAVGAKEDHSFLKNAGFNVVVYDEGHMLKNSSSDRFQKLMKLRANFRLLLTGTPLQNNLRELMSLLEFILPKIFVSKKEDLKAVFNQKAKTSNDNPGYNPLLSERAISKAKKMMAPFILRRKKDQVLQHLPPKVSEVEFCEMDKDQEINYFKEVERGLKLKESKNAKVSNILMGLRKAAIHPLLFRNIYDDEKLRAMSKKIMQEDVYRDANRDYIFEDMQVMTDFELNNLCSKFPSISQYQLNEQEFLKSGKVHKLKEILDQVIKIEDSKILIFSLFTQVLDILEVVLSIWDIKFLRLDGQTTVDSRHDIIDKFYEDDSVHVFLLSTKAGGFGINLVCANNVVIFDQSFNPHDDKQAEDRAHRVGQTKPVKVTRLISENTIEENIYQMTLNKLQLDSSISGEEIELQMEAAILDKIDINKDVNEQNEDELRNIDTEEKEEDDIKDKITRTKSVSEKEEKVDTAAEVVEID
ncbi:hypothetical protein WICMUC_002797 [Wickerhamomyces mucosus]|uniref:DNA helicase n=1 Tax=Wickerhamomyces mucosus TaxID=1378264 RepID=A0A9P8TE92_9ASCO|nr:hypothetical protein WICMUC_002797 [Wickerhamomyces mucosus]